MTWAAWLKINLLLQVKKLYFGTVIVVDSSWNVMSHGDGREGEVKGKLVEWVASTLHTTSKHGVSSITTADEHTSAASSRRNWRPPPI